MDLRESTSESQERPPLGKGINIATRSVHAKLNQNILGRFPRAVPPQANNPSVYASGLLHIAPVYLAFESLWNDYLDTHGVHTEKEDGNPETYESTLPGLLDPQQFSCDSVPEQHPPWKRVYSVLSHLYLPGLMRSESLVHDICSITGWTKDIVDEEIKAVAQTGRLGAFVAHIKRSIDNHPLVLLAYGWVLYMALFSGGRFISASLDEAGPDFWSATCGPVQPSGRTCTAPLSAHQRPSPASSENPSLPLSFFHFPTPQDGEDLKTTFKHRLLACQHLLTPEEHDQIVREAICIFENMNLLVAQLDSLFPSTSPADTTANSSPPDLTTASNPAEPGLLETWTKGLSSSLSLNPRWGRMRIRDSVAVTKERAVRAAAAVAMGGRSSGGETDSDGDGEIEDVEGQRHKHIHPGAEKSLMGPGRPRLAEESGKGILRRGDDEGDGERGRGKEKGKGVGKTVRFGSEVDVRKGGVACPRKQKESGEEEDGRESMVWNVALVLAVAGVAWGLRHAWM